MATPATSQPSTTMADQPPLAAPPILSMNQTIEDSTMNYANLLKPKTLNVPTRLIDLPMIPFKPVTLLHGEPYIKWSEEEVAAMDVVENLQHVVVGKFSYGWPEMDELRSIIPTQCNIKGNFQIGLFRNRHVLIRLSLKEDFINVTSKVAYYLKFKDGNSY